ncbi:MAG: hypothetical protein ACRBM6_31675 [Geminicoccales bacterium]
MSENLTEKRLPDTEKPAARKKKAGLSGRSDRLSTWKGSIWRQRWLSLVVAWILCMGGWIAVALWPSNYMSSAVIYADLNRLTDLDNASALGYASDASSDEGPVSQLKALLLTEESLAELRNNTGLADQSAANLSNDISIRVSAPTLFVASYDHQNPTVAHQVLDGLFSNFISKLNKAEEAETVELQQEIEALEAKLQKAEAAFAVFQQANADLIEGSNEPPSDINALETEIAELRARIELATVDRDEVAQELAELPLAQEASDEPESAATTPLSPSQLTELKELESKLVELRERYADSHPYVATVLDTIDALKAEGATAQAEADQSNEAIDESAIDEQTAELKKQHEEKIATLSTLNNDLANKQREIDGLRALTETTSSVEAEQSRLETERNDLEAALAKLVERRDVAQKLVEERVEQQDDEAEQTSFRLINEPSLPDKPTGLPRLLGLALVLFGGVGIGGGLAIVRNRSKGVFESAWQLKQRFDVGVLGTISEVLSPNERKKLGYAKFAFAMGCLGLMGIFGGLAVAEFLNLLTPWGDSLRTQLLG